MNKPLNDNPPQVLIDHFRQLGPLRFDQWMQKVLYDPSWGYYSQGDFIFGIQGDFITAPELTPLFGQAMALALKPLVQSGLSTIYEFGAGRGTLAKDLLSELGSQVHQYVIVELSGRLKSQQEKTITEGLPKEISEKVRWVSTLPEQLSGIVIGNELLDAMPVRRFRWSSRGITEAFVEAKEHDFKMQYEQADLEFTEQIEELHRTFGPWPEGYESEKSEQVPAFVRTITDRLNGFCLMIDYGLHAEQYYHASHTRGHLRAHSRHTAHDDFLFAPGQQDLTCHVNFTDVFEAIEQSGGALEGYCSQASFLLHHGLMDAAAKNPDLTDPARGGP
ncbi:MAG: SAM-dependent methyltransferase, partial [Limnobacter sp.]|nr:SAM-dependent methyltransferase [Limnobacter sp.]